MRDENQLHAAVVELVALDDASIKYSTVQNWYPGDADGKGGIYNFVTKRGRAGARAKISWTQVETGSAITWKYPSVILQGDDSVGEFYSVAVTTNRQQADTGTKMIHIGKNTTSTILSKGITAGHAQQTYRGLVKVLRSATGAREVLGGASSPVRCGVRPPIFMAPPVEPHWRYGHQRRCLESDRCQLRRHGADEVLVRGRGPRTVGAAARDQHL